MATTQGEGTDPGAAHGEISTNWRGVINNDNGRRTVVAGRAWRFGTRDMVWQSE